MTLSPRICKFSLTAHITFSVGWLGAVAGFLALAVAGLASRDTEMAHAAYVASELITWFVIVPLAFASLLSGLAVSLGTHWGLFRHYWVLAKLLINVLATTLLLLHTRPIGLMAGVARGTTTSSIDVGRLQFQLVADAGAALLALLVATSLAVYKPHGMTPYGRRRISQSIQSQTTRPTGGAHVAQRPSVPRSDGPGVERDRGSITSTPRWVYVSGIIAVVIVLVFVVLHLTGHGLGGH
jgi:hypothetical protein